MSEVSVAIPVRNGGELFAGVLRALAGQSVDHELLVCDSGSSDGSRERAREHGARVIEIPPDLFTHGGVRNRLMAAATGAHVALLTQDSEPAGPHWLESLLTGFDLAPDVALVYGTYVARSQAATPVRMELERWFHSLSPDGTPQVERLEPTELGLPAAEFIGRRGFFTDANACLAVPAWKKVPFRDIPYAEDRVLAMDMLRAGYAKAFLPQAAVIHSHDYSTGQQLQRCFDEWRGLSEVYGWSEPISPRRLLAQARGELGYARAALNAHAVPPRRRRAALASVARHHAVSRAGALLGSRANRLPASVRRRLSLEGRAGFTPLDMDERDGYVEEDPSK